MGKVLSTPKREEMDAKKQKAAKGKAVPYDSEETTYEPTVLPHGTPISKADAETDRLR